jgi:hypothetical protein
MLLATLRACVLVWLRGACVCASLLALVSLSRCMGSGVVGAWLSLVVCLHCPCVLALCLHAQCDVVIERHVFACMPSGKWA